MCYNGFLCTLALLLVIGVGDYVLRSLFGSGRTLFGWGTLLGEWQGNSEMSVLTGTTFMFYLS